MDTDRKNQCVQVSYLVPAVNHPRELLGVAVSKPLHPTATYDHSTLVGSSRHLQAGSVKKHSNEMCGSGVVHCSEQGHTVGGSHWRQHGIDLKHTQTGIDTREFSEVGSCGIPVNSACNEVSALKYSKASMGHQSVPAPKQVLVESSELLLRNESREACILNSIEVSDTSNLLYSPENSGICSKQAVVDGSLLSPALCGKMQANKPVMKAENDQNNDDSGNCDVVPNPKISISNYNSPLTSFSTVNQFMDTNSEEDSFVGDVVLNPKISISNCNIPLISFCTINQFTDTNSVKDSFVTAKVSDGSSSVEKISGSAKLSDLRMDINGSEKSSICRESTGSDVSDESSCTSFSNGINRPHKANDLNWEAIRAVRLRDGVLGLSHFRLLKRLGCGDIGSVYLALLCGTKSYFALKVMDKEALASRKKLPRAQTEREILQSLDHPFLPTLYTHFETDNFSCLVMEFCPGGDLHTLRQRQPGKYFPEEAARFYVAEVLLALEYLHMLGIIYRDLKPENILVRADGHIMLSDFDLSLRCVVCPTLVRSSNMGMSSSKKNAGYCVQPACIEPTCAIQPSCVQPTCFSPSFLSSTSKKEKKFKPKAEVYNQVNPLPELIAEPTSARSMSFVGTHEYLAPEIIKGEGHGSAVDWWTFGIFLYELLFGKTPFKGSGNRATLFNVVGQPLRFPEYPMVSFAARDLIRGLLVKEPQHRLAYKRGATEIKQHPFFQNVNWALIRCMSPPEVPKPVESVDFPQRTEVVEASTSEKMAGINVKPSGNYLEIDFF